VRIALLANFLLPFHQHEAAFNAKIPHLALPVGTVKVNVKKNVLAFQSVKSEASAPLSLAYRKRLAFTSSL